MSALRLVVFDVDGTLVDSQGHILAAMERAFAETPHAAPDREQVLSIVGLSLPQAMARLAPAAEPEERAALVDAYKQSFFELRRDGDPRAQSPLYPGTLNMLRRLMMQDEILIGLATGKSRRGTEAMLEAHGLSHIFVTQQVADDHPSKPHPAMLERALYETGVERADAVMIGDTEYDMQMACAAGVAALGVAWGYHPSHCLTGAGAQEVLQDWSGLPAALETTWKDEGSL